VAGHRREIALHRGISVVLLATAPFSFLPSTTAPITLKTFPSLAFDSSLAKRWEMIGAKLLAWKALRAVAGRTVLWKALARAARAIPLILVSTISKPRRMT